MNPPVIGMIGNSEEHLGESPGETAPVGQQFPKDPGNLARVVPEDAAAPSPEHQLLDLVPHGDLQDQLRALA